MRKTEYFTMCSFFLGEAGRGNCGIGRKEIETLRSVKVRRKRKMLKDVKNVRNNVEVSNWKTQAVKGSQKQGEPDFTVLTHNICCSVWLNQWTQRAALQSKGSVCEREEVRTWQDGEVDGELDCWVCAREKKKNRCYCGKADARTLWQQILIIQFLQSTTAERQEHWVCLVVAELCVHKPLHLGAKWIYLIRSFLEIFLGVT